MRQVVVRLFIGTQNRLVALHSALIQAHEETNNSPRSVRQNTLPEEGEFASGSAPSQGERAEPDNRGEKKN